MLKVTKLLLVFSMMLVLSPNLFGSKADAMSPSEYAQSAFYTAKHYAAQGKDSVVNSASSVKHNASQAMMTAKEYAAKGKDKVSELLTVENLDLYSNLAMEHKGTVALTVVAAVGVGFGVYKAVNYLKERSAYPLLVTE